MADNYFNANNNEETYETLQQICTNINELDDIRIQCTTLIKKMYNHIFNGYIKYKRNEDDEQFESEFLALHMLNKEEDENILIDSLAYIDQEYKNDTRVNEEMKRLIDEEMKNFEPGNYLDKYESIENSDFIKEEFKRIENKKKLPLITNIQTKFDLPPPNKTQDDQAWEIIHNRINLSLQHFNIKSFNLDLLIKYGPSTWKKYLSLFENLINQLEAEKETIEKRNEEINQERKFKQVI
jgi:pre-mRNA-splicing factor SPF27